MGTKPFKPSFIVPMSHFNHEQSIFYREFDTSKLKRILQSLETGLFFCQIFVFII